MGDGPPLDAAKQARQHLECVRSVNAVLRENQYVRHLLGAMSDRGCDVARSFFICEPCPPALSIGGYWHSGRGVVVCENVERQTAQIGRTMLHELVHAYDWCRIDLNPANCLHLACTEIRAANLSGDCNYAMEVLRGRALGFTRHKPECVKRMAVLSLQANPACANNAERAVDMAFERCWADWQPFDHVP